MPKPRIITYYLPGDGSTSKNYYKIIEDFAPRVIGQILTVAGEIVKDFKEYNSWKASETRITLDLLTLGVYLQDRINFNFNKEFLPKEEFLKSLLRLKEWLEKEKIGPLIPVLDSWINFLEHHFEKRSAINFQKTLGKIIKIFKEASAEVLNNFTPNVDAFLAQGNHEGRDDTEMRKSSRLEYHLNMVAAEIIGQEFQEAFLDAKKKIVLVPGCSGAQPEEKCEAIETPLGGICQECTPSCRVRALTRLGRRKGFETYIVGELSDVPKTMREKGMKVSDVGVLGIACILTLAPGGRDAESLGLPAQGVLLDYCGCLHHWNDNKEDLLITNFSKSRILEILNL